MSYYPDPDDWFNPDPGDLEKVGYVTIIAILIVIALITLRHFPVF